MSLYDAIDALMTAGTGSDIGIRVAVSPTDYELPQPVLDPDAVAATIRAYQTTLVQLWQRNELPAEISGAPTWSAPVPTGKWADLDPAQLIPLFSRTDESIDGHVYEVQCPGSWWGSYDVLERVLRPHSDALADRFTAELATVFPDGAHILHLFETSTSPHENHYFANRVRSLNPAFRYWALDPDADKDNCTFVRSHSYSGLVAEDMFRTRLSQLVSGTMRFDLPPIPVFDQKSPMALPFHPEYRHHFPDQVRTLFPYTALITDEQARLSTGERVSLSELLRRPSSERPYVLKYAGMDTTRNWGARGVIALKSVSTDRTAELLDALAKDEAHGEPWVMQSEVASRGEMFVQDKNGTTHTESAALKVNHFLGPTKSLGKLVQGSPGGQVHWSGRTTLSLARE